MHTSNVAASRTAPYAGHLIAPMRILAIDDHPMYSCGLAAVLADEPGCVWLGATHSAGEALRAAESLRPDVVLLDRTLGGSDGLALLAALRALVPQVRCVLICDDGDLVTLRAAADSDADGVVLRSADSAELLHVVRAAWRGERRVSSVVQQMLSAQPPRHVPGDDLTPRERDLLGLMARGLSNREIATQCGIALPTVKFHVTNIMSKLGADNRTAAVIAALRYRIVSIG